MGTYEASYATNKKGIFMKSWLCSVGILATGLFASSVVAQGMGGQFSAVELTQLTLMRSGGGQLTVVVEMYQEAVMARTTQCKNKTLSDQASRKTQFRVVDQEANATIQALFKNSPSAMLAEDVTPRPVGMATGTFFSLTADYSEFVDGRSTEKSVGPLFRPLILVDGKVSGALETIEQAARAANAATCR